MQDFEKLSLSEKVEQLDLLVFGKANCFRKIKNYGFYFEVIPNGTLSTFDNSRLTMLVLAAHRFCIRAEIVNNGTRGLKIILHDRSRSGQSYERHPTLEQAISSLLAFDETSDVLDV